MRAEDDSQWYALRVAPQREYEVSYLLQRQGLSTFIPTEIRTHKRSSYSKGKVEFAVPIIPGLVFAGFPSAPAWYNVLRIHMILGPIGRNDQPWRFDFVELLKFFAGVNDGRMVMDDGLRLIHIPGRAPVRPLTTRARIISHRNRPERKKKPECPATTVPVQPPPRKIVDFLSRFVHGNLV